MADNGHLAGGPHRGRACVVSQCRASVPPAPGFWEARGSREPLGLPELHTSSSRRVPCVCSGEPPWAQEGVGPHSGGTGSLHRMAGIRVGSTVQGAKTLPSEKGEADLVSGTYGSFRSPKGCNIGFDIRKWILTPMSTEEGCRS